MADLISMLARSGRTFGFFQAVSLLEEYFRNKDGDTSPTRSGRLRFQSDPSIGFPASDIAAVRTGDGVVTFFLTFLGLTGVSSPLPNYFSDYIARYPESAQALTDFCALFNQRIYALFYRAFRKYRFPLAVADPRFLFKLRCLAAQPQQGHDGALRLLAYSGVLSSRRRSARGLETMVSDLFGGIPVEIRQWVGRWTALPDPPRLGSDNALGVNSMVGTRIFDRSGKFRVRIGPLERSTYESFLEGSENLAALRNVVFAYMADPLEFDVEVRLRVSQLEPVVLGEQSARLGQTASLGGGSELVGDENAVILSGMAA